MFRIGRFSAALAVSVSSIALATAVPAGPAWADNDRVLHTHYDGVTNDLLTAGLGALGLQGAAPAVADPLNPTAEELRRLAIYNNYRALVDISTKGGFTVLYGPNVKPDGTALDPSVNKGLIAGDEYLAFEKEANARARVTMMVQIPDSYDPANGCIVAAPSSGSRGVYGAIATAGEWGLKHGCAVAYTDKGTGTGAHDLQSNTVNRIQGQRADAAQAGDSNFTANVSDSQRAAFDTATPNRFAFKHAHSQQNPEADWGNNVLRSVKFAFSLLNEKFHGRGVVVNKRNTIVIASSVSNGGGASARAVEQDADHLIDGLAVGEPNVNPKFTSSFTIVQGGGPAFAAHSRTLIDYVTLLTVFQGCANVANPAAPFNFAPSPQRCANLHAKGLLTSTTPAAQATEAQQIINNFGILPEQNVNQPVLWFSFVSQAIAVTYANAYGRFSVLDNLCNYSFAGTAASVPAPLAPAVEAQVFGTSNGIPPTATVSLINNAAPGGAKEDRASTPDQNLDGALCLRSLATGKDAVTGTPLAGTARDQARRIAQGVDDIIASGNLHRTPAIFVTGRSDGILPPNFASRAYFGLNNVVEGSLSPLHYYEVTNAQHLDNINALPGFDTIYIPLHRYFIQAMDLMYDHLRHGRALPPSQVVHTVPRGGTPGAAPQITLSNVPAIADAPAASAVITFANGQVNIPN